MWKCNKKKEEKNHSQKLQAHENLFPLSYNKVNENADVFSSSSSFNFAVVVVMNAKCKTNKPYGKMHNIYYNLEKENEANAEWEAEKSRENTRMKKTRRKRKKEKNKKKNE